MAKAFRLSILALVILASGVLLFSVLSVLALPVSPELPQSPEPPPLLAENAPLSRPSRFFTQAAPASLPAPAPPIPLPDPAWRIGVITDGLVALDYATLAAVGVPVTTTPRDHYRLFWRGEELALDDSAVGTSFAPGEAFYFYGEQFHGSVQDEKYTDENVYWLTVDPETPGLRMESRDVTPDGSGTPITWYTETLRTEENLLYWGRHSTMPRTDTTWFWKHLRTNTAVTTYSFPIELNALWTGAYTASLHIELAGYTENHQQLLRLTLNDLPIGEVTWYGRRGYFQTLTFPSEVLQEGDNTLRIGIYKLTSRSPEAYLDHFEITYRRQPVALADGLILSPHLPAQHAMTVTNFSAPAVVRLYDVGDPFNAVRLTGATTAGDAIIFSDTPLSETRYLAAAEGQPPHTLAPYQLATELLQPETGADVIAITPRAFFAALEPWAERRREQGYRVQLVDVEDTYALFNGGILHPEAIRAFVAYAHQHWPGPPPAYLLLAGDGHFNFKGYNPERYGEFVPIHVPPYLAFLDPDQGEVPVDSYYGDLDGDGIAELAVGRLTAENVANLEAMVAKILGYEEAVPGDWERSLLFVADDGITSVEPFAAALETLIADYTPPGHLIERRYMQDYWSTCGREAPNTSPCPTFTHALTQAWSHGPALLTYAGHGSINRWGHEPLLRNVDVATLDPMGSLPFIISLDCWDGYWMFPAMYPVSGAQDARSLGQWATSVLTDRGAIALFGPAGLGYLYIEKPMVEAMYTALFEEGQRTLGDLTHAARGAVSWSYLARTYTLLGDPTVQLPARLIAKQNHIYLPLVLRQ